MFRWLVFFMMFTPVTLLAQDSKSELPDSYFYSGIEILPNNKYKISLTSGHEKRDLSTGFAINTGYQFYLSQDFSLGTEIEYQELGEWTESGATFDSKNEWNSISLNFKPTFHLADNGFFISGRIGYGSYRLFYDNKKNSSTTIGNTSRGAYNLGVETGYQFKHLDLTIGYKLATLAKKIDNTDVDHSALSVGLRYKW